MVPHSSETVPLLTTCPSALRAQDTYRLPIFRRLCCYHTDLFRKRCIFFSQDDLASLHDATQACRKKIWCPTISDAQDSTQDSEGALRCSIHGCYIEQLRQGLFASCPQRDPFRCAPVASYTSTRYTILETAKSTPSLDFVAKTSHRHSALRSHVPASRHPLATMVSLAPCACIIGTSRYPSLLLPQVPRGRLRYSRDQICYCDTEKRHAKLHAVGYDAKRLTCVDLRQ